MPGSCMTGDRDLARAWRAVLGELELDLPRASFVTFLEGSRFLRRDGNTLVIEGNRLNVEEVNGRLRTLIERAAYRVLGEELTVLFIPRGSGGFGGGHPASAVSVPGAGAGTLVGNVNRRFTFDRYIEADGNRLAHRCCLDVLDGDVAAATPVVVYGRPGMGKTHLLHALAARAAEAGWNVACLSAEEFTSRFTGAIARKRMDDFQDSLRSVRLLLIDDIQELAGRKATQDELVHTVDAVAHAGGRVVAASEQHPMELDLPERLASRLSAGIMIGIMPFIAGERRRFVEMLARESGMALPGWAIDRVTGIEAPSVRVLQGATQAAIALARHGLLDLAQLDAQLVRVAAAEVFPGAFVERELLEAVARHFELCFEDLTSESRKPAATAARAVAAAILQDRGRSLSQIGDVLGRHRSTIKGLAERGRLLLERDGVLRARLAG